jgi:hypothetical protein
MLGIESDRHAGKYGRTEEEIPISSEFVRSVPYSNHLHLQLDEEYLIKISPLFHLFTSSQSDLVASIKPKKTLPEIRFWFTKI